MPPIVAGFFLDSGLTLSLVCAVIGLGFAFYLIKSILASSAAPQLFLAYALIRAGSGWPP